LDIWIGKIDNFIPQLFWKAQIHPTVDTIFWHVSKKVILWRGGCRFGRNQKMYRIRIGRWGATDGPEEIFHKDADPRDLVIGRWEVANEPGGKKEI
jgi:hypothetical protein